MFLIISPIWYCKYIYIYVYIHTYVGFMTGRLGIIIYHNKCPLWYPLPKRIKKVFPTLRSTSRKDLWEQAASKHLMMASFSEKDARSVRLVEKELGGIRWCVYIYTVCIYAYICIYNYILVDSFILLFIYLFKELDIHVYQVYLHMFV